jgi:hypothetical protein
MSGDNVSETLINAGLHHHISETRNTGYVHLDYILTPSSICCDNKWIVIRCRNYCLNVQQYDYLSRLQRFSNMPRIFLNPKLSSMAEQAKRYGVPHRQLSFFQPYSYIRKADMCRKHVVDDSRKISASTYAEVSHWKVRYGCQTCKPISML